MRFIHRHGFSIPSLTHGNVLGAAKFALQRPIAHCTWGASLNNRAIIFAGPGSAFLARSLIARSLSHRPISGDRKSAVMHEIAGQVHWHEPSGFKRAGFGKFGRPKTPYDLFMESEGVPVYRDIGVSKVQNLPMHPWPRLGGGGSNTQCTAPRVNGVATSLKCPAPAR